MGLVAPHENVERTGTVSFDGTDLTSQRPKDLRRFWGDRISMVFQDPMTSLNPVRKIGAQLIESMREHQHISRRDAMIRAVGLLASVGVPEPEQRLHQHPHQLSGGMRQRVTIAMALSCDPELILADEPTTALDVTVQAQILDLLQDQQTRRQMAMILVTHDLAVVRGRARRIVVMYAGQIVEMAAASRLFEAPHMPYTEALIAAVPQLEGPIHVELRAIGGRPPNLVSPPAGCRFSPRCPIADERCRQQQPPLVAAADDSDHWYRCWKPLNLGGIVPTVGVPLRANVVTGRVG
jgi:peptide/nickel transport system ATP-binding protein